MTETEANISHKGCWDSTVSPSLAILQANPSVAPKQASHTGTHG